MEPLLDLATTVQWLAQSKDRFGRTEEAIAHFRELTGPAPLARVQRPADRLRAMLSLSQLLKKTSAFDEAKQWLSAAQTYGATEEVPAAEALHAFVDSVQQLFPESYHPLRLAELQTLWETRRFESLPEWYVVGDELTSAYFFQEPPQMADFELVSRQLLKSLPTTLRTLPVGSLQRSELESLYATNLLLAADSARSRSDDVELARCVTLFEDTFDGRDVRFTSPLNRPAQRMHRMGEIYRTTMLKHVEQLRQNQAQRAEPPRL